MFTRLPVVVAICTTLCLTLSACSLFPESETYKVPMRDGTTLSTDVYLPDGAGESAKFPVILMRTTYNKGAKTKGMKIHALMAKPYLANGYAIVVQDTRGRFESEGVDSIFFTDRNDGYDTVDWIASQPWCDGNVGMFGMSALGIPSYMAVSSGHPALKCAYIVASASNLYHDVFYPGGVYRKNMGDNWVTGQGREEFLPFIHQHSNYDEYWERVNLGEQQRTVSAAVYHASGWFDAMVAGQINGFKSLHEGGGPGARGKQKLVMGAWSHGGTGNKQGEIEYPGNTNDLNILSEALPFFNSHLKGMATKTDSVAAVRYYLLGDPADSTDAGNRWYQAGTWPPEGSGEMKLYLNAGGKLTKTPPAGTSQSTSYVYDPQDPVPTIGGLNLYKPIGPADLKDSVESRADVISFTTEPLTEKMVIAGNVRFKLWASSSAKDTDFMVMLSDVYPDGRSMLMMDGAISARHRESLRSEKFMIPGTIYVFDVDLWDIALSFAKGHRVRVNITSSNSPRFEPNMNTGLAMRADTVGIKATNTIYFDAEGPSSISLPMIPVRKLVPLVR
jgi:uncharacterized protein